MGRRWQVVLLAAALLLSHPALLQASSSGRTLASVGASSMELGRLSQAQTSAVLAPGIFMLSSLFVLNSAGLVTAHPAAARVMGIIGTTFGLIAVGIISGALATTSPSSSAGIATLTLPPAVTLLAMGVMSAVVPRLQRPRLWMAVATASPLSVAGIIVSIPLMASGYEALTGVALFIPSLALAGISIYAAVRLGQKPKRKKTLPPESLRTHRLVPLDPYEPVPPPPGATTSPTTSPTSSPGPPATRRTHLRDPLQKKNVQSSQRKNKSQTGRIVPTSRPPHLRRLLPPANRPPATRPVPSSRPPKRTAPPLQDIKPPDPVRE